MKRLFFKWKGFTLNEKDLHNEKLGGNWDEKDLLFYEKVFQMKRFSTFLYDWKRNKIKSISINPYFAANAKQPPTPL